MLDLQLQLFEFFAAAFEHGSLGIKFFAGNEVHLLESARQDPPELLFGFGFQAFCTRWQGGTEFAAEIIDQA